MKRKLGPIEVNCDAPEHDVVKACLQLNLKRPLDVPWRRVGSAQPHQCVECDKTNAFKKYAVSFRDGRKLMFWFAQCQRCLTIHWRTDAENYPPPAAADENGGLNNKTTNSKLRATRLIAILALLVILFLLFAR